MDVPIKDVEEDDLEVAVHRQDDDSNASAEDHEFSGYIRTLASTDLSFSNDRIHLGIVRCTSAQPQQVNDWRKTTTFHTFTKIGEENCKVIVDNESSINAVSTKVIERCGLKTIPHPHLYKVSWINSTTPKIKQRCLVLIEFNLYKNKIWCDVVTMDVGQIILSRS